MNPSYDTINPLDSDPPTDKPDHPRTYLEVVPEKPERTLPETECPVFEDITKPELTEKISSPTPPQNSG